MSQEKPRLTFSGPVRTIRPSRRSLTGQITVKRRAVEFESALERDLLLLLDFDRNVKAVHEQPCEISYGGEHGTSRRYTPDFHAELYSGRDLLFEVKYRDDLRKNWVELRPRLRAGVGYARMNGARFKIMTEVEIRSVRLKNVTFLRRYRDEERHYERERHLLLTLWGLGQTTPNALLAAAYCSREQRMAAITSLWRLVAHHKIFADLYRPLTMETPIWSFSGEENWR